MAMHMILSDPGEIRMFKQQCLIHYAGVRVGREFLDMIAKSKNYANGLEGLLNDSSEKNSIVKAYGKLHVNDHYRAFASDPQATPIPDFLEKADIIRLKYLMQASPTLKAAAGVPLQHKIWWRNNSANSVIDRIFQSDIELAGKPGSALLGLYHVRNKIAHPPDAGQFALDEESFEKWSETTKKAIRVLAIKVYGANDGTAKANQLIDEALHIADETTCEDFHSYQRHFDAETMNESGLSELLTVNIREIQEVILAVLKDPTVKQQYINKVDVKLIAIHLTSGSILDFGDELEPLEKIPEASNRKNKLFDLLLLKLNTFAKFKFFCAKLIDIGQKHLADVFERRFEEELAHSIE